MDLQSRFREVVQTEEEFRAVMGSPSALVTRKELTKLDSHAREFIGRSPFLLIGTSGANGQIDMSPKGDPPGFVQVLDEKTLAIPDRLGNRRADTFMNLIVNDQIGLIFFVPGKQETLRVRWSRNHRSRFIDSRTNGSRRQGPGVCDRRRSRSNVLPLREVHNSVKSLGAGALAQFVWPSVSGRNDGLGWQAARVGSGNAGNS